MELSKNPAKLNIKVKNAGTLSFFMGMLVLLLGAVSVTAFLWLCDWEPSGGDIWGHLYKSKFMYDSLSEGLFIRFIQNAGIMEFSYTGIGRRWYIMSCLFCSF